MPQKIAWRQRRSKSMFHSGGAYLMAAAILISTFGCANGMSLAGARVYYAMSQDGLFFKSVGKLQRNVQDSCRPVCWSGCLDGGALRIGLL